MSINKKFVDYNAKSSVSIGESGLIVNTVQQRNHLFLSAYFKNNLLCTILSLYY